LLINLTPDKQHTNVIESVMPLMKKNACLSYSHGFNIVEEGMQIRKDLTVIMVAPKAPGTELREEYKRGFGVPTLIAVHKENDPRQEGMELAKAYASGIGGDRAGVLHSSFIAEVKSDLMGEQTILCGVLQTGSLLCYDKMIQKGIEPQYASKLVQYGWETLTEALKHGGVTHMMNRLDNPSKLMAQKLSNELKTLLKPMFHQHMDDIMSGKFSHTMMEDWTNDDADLLKWRNETAQTAFEQSTSTGQKILEQEYFDNGILMVAFVKAGVELAFDTMVSTGIGEESAYYESLHELPLIANLIARKKLYEMNVVISDTAEYGCYLFNHKALPLLSDFMEKLDVDVIGKGLNIENNGVDNLKLIKANEAIHSTGVEQIGEKLRSYMGAMKPLT
ncbi:MAG: ketol-acid reductoisomerase, partial [Deltaproteobacteria bacterium]